MDLATSVLKGPLSKFRAVEFSTGQRVLPTFNSTRADVKQGPVRRM